MFWSRALLLAAVLLINPVLLATPQKPTNDFDTFFAAFKAAVEQKNRAVLASLMSPHFDFILATNVSKAAVFSGLDSSDGQQWHNLRQALEGTPVPYAGDGPYRNSRVLRCTPINVTSNCLVIFSKVSHKGWRWRAMVMPTR